MADKKPKEKDNDVTSQQQPSTPVEQIAKEIVIDYHTQEIQRLKDEISEAKGQCEFLDRENERLKEENERLKAFLKPLSDTWNNEADEHWGKEHPTDAVELLRFIHQYGLKPSDDLRYAGQWRDGVGNYFTMEELYQDFLDVKFKTKQS